MTYGKSNQYKANAVKTATPGQVLIMLYEAAILNIKKAKEAIEQKNMAVKGKHITKAHDIINELTNTLNFEVGGTVARDLESLYNFMISQMIKANIENNIDALTAVQQNLETLLDGWRQAVAKFNKEQGLASKRDDNTA